MRKRKPGKKLSRKKSHRQALLRNLSQDLFLYGQIKTTLPKAKALRPFAEQLITKSRRGTMHAQSQIAAVLYKKEAVIKLMKEIGPRFEREKRPGGYTKILKLGKRRGDGTEEALIALVGSTKDHDTKNAT